MTVISSLFLHTFDDGRGVCAAVEGWGQHTNVLAAENAIHKGPPNNGLVRVLALSEAVLMLAAWRPRNGPFGRLETPKIAGSNAELRFDDPSSGVV